jgi:hypothetical protein
MTALRNSKPKSFFAIRTQQAKKTQNGSSLFHTYFVGELESSAMAPAIVIIAATLLAIAAATAILKLPGLRLLLLLSFGLRKTLAPFHLPVFKLTRLRLLLLLSFGLRK